MFAVATDERLSRVGCDFWYTDLAGGRVENQREGRGSRGTDRETFRVENRAERRNRTESERNRTTIIIVKTEYLAG